MKRGDIAITALIIIVLAWFAFSSLGKDHTDDHAAYAAIYVNGELYDHIALTEEEYEFEIKSERGYNLLKVSQYGIEMIESNCPDHICIGFGHIHSSGDNIVCLPNRIFVEIEGSPDSEGVDAIVS
jgi:hypothetical protein